MMKVQEIKNKFNMITHIYYELINQTRCICYEQFDPNIRGPDSKIGRF